MSGAASNTATQTLHKLESYGMAFRQLPRALFVGANNFFADGLFNQCAAISYYALLSVPAFVSLLAAILGFMLGSPEEGMGAAVENIGQLIPDLPDEIVSVAAGFFQYRGTIGAAALLVSLWIAHLVFAAIQTADLGRAILDGNGERIGFDVLGREPGAEAKGCSIATDVMLEASGGGRAG